MGTDTRDNSSPVIEDLISNAPSYNVWQAVRIADSYIRKGCPDKYHPLFDQPGIKFRPFEKYEYPAGDIKSIEYEEGLFIFVLTFLGLYGINSPLPRCYHEQVDFQQRILGKGQVPLQNFLDIFNNRFYWLYYQSWKKYRFYLHLNSDENNPIIERINSFSGRGFFSKKENAALPGYTLLKFSGLFSQRVRNKSGLQILIGHLFPHFPVLIKEFVPSWLELTDVPVLGSSENILGETSFIGKRSLNYTSRIGIEIGPISFTDYLDFLPGQKYSKEMIELLDLYLNDGLEYDFSFKIRSETIVSVAWNDERLRLGSAVWLGKPQQEIVKMDLPFEELFKLSDNLAG